MNSPPLLMPAVCITKTIRNTNDRRATVIAEGEFCPRKFLSERLCKRRFCLILIKTYEQTGRQSDRKVAYRDKEAGKETGIESDVPLSYFPSEHVRVVSLTATHSANDVVRRHLGLTATDVSRVY